MKGLGEYVFELRGCVRELCSVIQGQEERIYALEVERNERENTENIGLEEKLEVLVRYYLQAEKYRELKEYEEIVNKEIKEFLEDEKTWGLNGFGSATPPKQINKDST
jgi:hypothetical protein